MSDDIHVWASPAPAPAPAIVELARAMRLRVSVRGATLDLDGWNLAALSLKPASSFIGTIALQVLTSLLVAPAGIVSISLLPPGTRSFAEEEADDHALRPAVSDAWLRELRPAAQAQWAAAVVGRR